MIFHGKIIKLTLICHCLMALLDLVFAFHITLQLLQNHFCLDLPFVLFYLFFFEHPCSILKPDRQYLTSKGLIVKFFIDYLYEEKWILRSSEVLPKCCFCLVAFLHVVVVCFFLLF